MTDGRLLPWPGPEGTPCRLIGDSGWLSRLADELEETQLDTGERVVSIAGQMLADDSVPAPELRFLARQLTMALTDALRVAESRGERLPVEDDQDED